MHKQASQALATAMAVLRRELRDVEKRIAALQPLTNAGAMALRAEHQGAGRTTEGWTQAKRTQVSERMRAYWAAKKQAAADFAEQSVTALHAKGEQELEDGVEGFRNPRRQWPQAARTQASVRMQKRWQAIREGDPPPAVPPA